MAHSSGGTSFWEVIVSLGRIELVTVEKLRARRKAEEKRGKGGGGELGNEASAQMPAGSMW